MLRCQNARRDVLGVNFAFARFGSLKGGFSSHGAPAQNARKDALWVNFVFRAFSVSLPGDCYFTGSRMIRCVNARRDVFGKNALVNNH